MTGKFWIYDIRLSRKEAMILILHRFLLLVRFRSRDIASSSEDRLTALNKVIAALQADERLRHGSARMHAQMLRAQTYLSNLSDFSAALEDAQALLSIPRVEGARSADTVGRLRRMEAEALEGLRRYKEAIQSWQLVAKSDPQFATKAKNEVARLLRLQEQLSNG
jgi:tetratricopeptide (TPR) repeat protein